MKKLIVVFFLFSASTIYAQDKSHDILLRVASIMHSKQSLSYDIAFTYKNSETHDNDTARLTAKVAMLRDSRDTILGGMAWVAPRGKILQEYTPGTFMFYDLKHAYKVFAASKNIVFQDPHITKPVFMFDIWPQTMVWVDFLKTNKIKELSSSSYAITMLKDTIIDKHLCYSIMIKPIDNKNEWHWIWYINKQDYFPVCREEWVLNGNNYQYEKFLIKSYTFNQVNKDRFSVKQLPADYKKGEIKPD